MANYRQVHCSMWSDPWYLDLDPQEKLLFIYFFSNERTSLSGLYELSIKVVSFETGLSLEVVKQILEKFQAAGKVYMEGSVVWVVHMRKFHETKSDTVLKRIQADIDMVSDCELKRKYLAYAADIPYAYPMDTVSTPHTQLKEEEEEKGKGNKLKDSLSDDEQKYIGFADAFRELTGLEPKPTKHIVEMLLRFYDAEVTVDEYRKAIVEMQENGYTIATMRSPETWVFNNRNAKRTSPELEAGETVEEHNAKVIMEVINASR